jgi:hypothetical protein
MAEGSSPLLLIHLCYLCCPKGAEGTIPKVEPAWLHYDAKTTGSGRNYAILCFCGCFRYIFGQGRLIDIHGDGFRRSVSGFAYRVATMK